MKKTKKARKQVSWQGGEKNERALCTGSLTTTSLSQARLELIQIRIQVQSKAAETRTDNLSAFGKRQSVMGSPISFSVTK